MVSEICQQSELPYYYGEDHHLYQLHPAGLKRERSPLRGRPNGRGGGAFWAGNAASPRSMLVQCGAPSADLGNLVMTRKALGSMLSTIFRRANSSR